MDVIYLDNNATTQPAPQVVAAMHEAAERYWANPSSVHRLGQTAKQRVELARAQVAKLLNASEAELTFTSGGTEANNLALFGLLGPGSAAAAGKAGIARRVLVTTATEHAAVRDPAEALQRLGVTVVTLPTTVQGVVQPSTLADALAEHADEQTLVLVSIHWANNETGVIQPVAAFAEQVAAARAAGHRVLLHVDGTQAVGKLPVDVKASGLDLMTWAAHKFHGPKGVGGLYVRRGVRVRAQNLGGPQERERRGGTENTLGIIGAGVAAELAQDFLADEANRARLAAMRDRFEQAVVEKVNQPTQSEQPNAHANPSAEYTPAGGSTPRTKVNALAADRLWNTTNLAFRNIEAEALLLLLSERGVCASAGAACSSGSLEPSPVLLAMGIEEAYAHGSLRFSLSRYTTEAEMARATEVVAGAVDRLSATLPMG